MLPFWIDLGSLPGFMVISLMVTGMMMGFLPFFGIGSRT